jgi:hypothetical protein
MYVNSGVQCITVVISDIILKSDVITVFVACSATLLWRGNNSRKHNILESGNYSLWNH